MCTAPWPVCLPPSLSAPRPPPRLAAHAPAYPLPHPRHAVGRTPSPSSSRGPCVRRRQRRLGLNSKCSGDDKGDFSLSFSFDAIRGVRPTPSITSSVSAAAAQVESDIGASPTCPALVQSQPAAHPTHTLCRAAALKRTTHVLKRSSKGTTYARKDSADKENCSSGADTGAHGNIQTPRRARLARFQLHR
jgi:hypothetical protein